MENNRMRNLRVPTEVLEKTSLARESVKYCNTVVSKYMNIYKRQCKHWYDTLVIAVMPDHSNETINHSQKTKITSSKILTELDQSRKVSQEGRKRNENLKYMPRPKHKDIHKKQRLTFPCGHQKNLKE